MPIPGCLGGFTVQVAGRGVQLYHGYDHVQAALDV